MPEKLHKTAGLVLRAVKYGETSLVVTMYTELFGIQSYLVNGVRTSSPRGGVKAGMFQPAALLDLVVYHNEQRSLQRLREYKWGRLYQRVLSDVPRHAAALFIIELLSRCLKQPENNPDLFHFTEDILLQLDRCENAVFANLPLFFALHLPYHFGFRMADNFNSERCILDWQEGCFISHSPAHPHYTEGKAAQFVAELLRVQQPEELAGLRAQQSFRRELLARVETYYQLHVPEFGRLKSMPVLLTLLNE